ncbi:MAG: hypothetical protein DMD67_14280 [Gemmatimonadetes bacterium]|nr:MAG: hypothetical protein DMD67_14280 [Gemmatimonadota bacterium]
MTPRLRSLDAFRGLTIAGMLLVNDPGSWSYVYPPLDHAEWNGWTLTDLIFPFFLFIVGISLTLSFSRRMEQGATPPDLLRKVGSRADSNHGGVAADRPGVSRYGHIVSHHPGASAAVDRRRPARGLLGDDDARSGARVRRGHPRAAGQSRPIRGPGGPRGAPLEGGLGPRGDPEHVSGRGHVPARRHDGARAAGRPAGHREGARHVRVRGSRDARGRGLEHLVPDQQEPVVEHVRALHGRLRPGPAGDDLLPDRHPRTRSLGVAVVRLWDEFHSRVCRVRTVRADPVGVEGGTTGRVDRLPVRMDLRARLRELGRPHEWIARLRGRIRRAVPRRDGRAL